MKYILIYINIIKGSWEAILPCYEWLLLWWRVVREWDLILMQLTMMKGGARVRLDYDEGWCASETWSGEEGKWWWRGVVTKGSGEEGKWWRREVMMKGSGDEGKWWRWEVVTKGSGDDGKWWGREVVRKGSGDEGKWWGREVVKKGSDDEGKWWRREVVTMGSGEEGKWWGREVVKKGSGEEGKWRWRGVRIALEWLHECRMGRSTKPCVFPCKVAAAGDERYLICAAVAAGVVPDAIGSSYGFCKTACSCVRSSMRFLKLWLRLGSFRTRLVPPMGFARMLVPVCVVLCVSWSCGCRSHWNGCMNVAWAMFWGGSWSTKPCVFPCKVAAAADERYLVCAAVAAGVVPDAIGSSYGFCKNACSCVRSSICVSWSCGCRSHWNGCMNVAWAMLWRGSQSTKPCIFLCKVVAGDDERYLVCAAVAAGVVPDAIGSSYVFCNKYFFLWCSSIRFLKLWLQIALEWLHECRMGYVLGRKLEHETLCFSV